MKFLKPISIAGFVVAAASIALLVSRRWLFASTFPAGAVQLGALAVLIWARIVFGRRSFHAAANPTEGGLVTSGPYKFVRHPIYASAIWFTWAGVCTHFTTESSLLALLVTAGLIIRMIAEEQLVTERYPEYAEYAAITKRVIPFII